MLNWYNDTWLIGLPWSWFKLNKNIHTVSGVCCTVLSCFCHVWFFATLWTVAYQAPLSMGFSRPEYWNGLPCPPPGALPDSGIELMSLISPALAGGFFTTSATWEAHRAHSRCSINADSTNLSLEMFCPHLLKFLEKDMATHSNYLAGESHGQRNLVRLHSSINLVLGFFLLCHTGLEPMSTTVGAHSLSHRTTRKVPGYLYFYY